MAKTYDIDAAIANDRPAVKLRGQKYLLADLQLREKLSRARQLQAKQEALEKKEEELKQDIQSAVWSDDAEDISEEEIRQKHEEVAERYADVVQELLKLTVVRPVYEDENKEQFKTDENFRIVTEPFPEDVLEDLTELEVQALNSFVEQATEEGITPEVREGE